MKQISCAILFFSILACGAPKSKNKQDNVYSGWGNFETKNYSIQYPVTWRLDTSGYQGSDFSIFSRQTSLLDKFIENVNLMVYNLSEVQLDFSQYIEITEEKIKSVAVDSLLLESERLNLNGFDFQKIIYTKRQGIYLLMFEQYHWVLNNKAFVLTLSCKANEFKNYQKTGEHILNSFNLK